MDTGLLSDSVAAMQAQKVGGAGTSVWSRAPSRELLKYTCDGLSVSPSVTTKPLRLSPIQKLSLEKALSCTLPVTTATHC